MKRFMKGCGIVAMVLIIIGVSVGMAGRTVAGKDTISQVVEAVTGGRFHMGRGFWWNWNSGCETSTIVDNIGAVAILDEVEYNVAFAEVYEEDGVTTFDHSHSHSTLYEEAQRYCVGNEIRRLDIQIEGGSFITAVSGDNSIYLEADGDCKYQRYVEGDTLYIKATATIHKWGNDNFWCTLYIPEGYFFDEINIEIGAGDMFFECLNAEKASMEVGAGSIVVDSMQVQDLDIYVGAGSIVLTNLEVAELDVEVGMGEFIAEDTTINKKADIECSMGSVDIGVKGSANDFNYHLESSAGNIQVEGISYISAGFGQERTIDNKANKEIDIACSMGYISVWFTE